MAQGAGNPMHSSLAVTANTVTSSHMLISQERITWFSSIPTEVGGAPRTPEYPTSRLAQWFCILAVYQNFLGACPPQQDSVFHKLFGKT